jgi:hypothetical protein
MAPVLKPMQNFLTRDVIASVNRAPAIHSKITD